MGCLLLQQLPIRWIVTTSTSADLKLQQISPPVPRQPSYSHQLSRVHSPQDTTRPLHALTLLRHRLHRLPQVSAPETEPLVATERSLCTPHLQHLGTSPPSVSTHLTAMLVSDRMEHCGKCRNIALPRRAGCGGADTVFSYQRPLGQGLHVVDDVCW
jgi:hypothetical protein